MKLLNIDVSTSNFKGKQTHTVVVQRKKHLHLSQFPVD